MTASVSATTPRDPEAGDRVNLPAPKAPPWRSILVWGAAAGGLQWRSVADAGAPAAAPGSAPGGTAP